MPTHWTVSRIRNGSINICSPSYTIYRIVGISKRITSVLDVVGLLVACSTTLHSLSQITKKNTIPAISMPSSSPRDNCTRERIIAVQSKTFRFNQVVSKCARRLPPLNSHEHHGDPWQFSRSPQALTLQCSQNCDFEILYAALPHLYSLEHVPYFAPSILRSKFSQGIWTGHPLTISKKLKTNNKQFRGFDFEVLDFNLLGRTCIPSTHQ